MMGTLWGKISKAMFESLLRRETKVNQSDVASDARVEKQASDESEKRAALFEADKVAEDEVAAVEFILRCGFADARLRAAEHIHARPFLEQVLGSMRKVDRRVAKLMQTRLDAIAKRELIAKHAEDYLGVAQNLLLEMPLMPNRVAEIDRAWRSIGEVSETHQSRFDVFRAEMERRLTAQMALQRSAIDMLEKLRRLNQTRDAQSVEQRMAALEEIAQAWSSYLQAPEFSSLPKNLVADFHREYLHQKSTLSVSQQREAIPLAQETLLVSWETKEIGALDVNEMKQVWAKLPLPADDEKPVLQQRFDALLDRVASRTAKKQPEKRSAVQTAEPSAVFEDALQAMEQAIQGGRLHTASEKDALLRQLERQSPRPNPSQLMRLSHARGDLKRLEGWARWSGNVSREELIKFVEEFSSQGIPVSELAKAVSGARERWKALDVQSGAASKGVWERFDAACTTAYAPVAAHLKNQAQVRQQNKEKAEALIADIQQFVESSGLTRKDDPDASLDWKRIASFYQGMTQSWQRIGHMDRKDKKRLDAAFDAARQLLGQPLDLQWAAAISKRESLIAEAETIATTDRKAMDKVRAIRQRWQECAKAMPLEYKAEQALWKRFRSACDAVFSQRKATMVAVDVERKKNAERKDALCAMLEAAKQESEAAIREVLRETEIAWKKIGPVLRAKEQQIDARYRKAMGVLQGRLKTIADAAKQAQRHAQMEKLALCRAVETALVNGAELDASWQDRWQKMHSLNDARDNLLRKRFDAALKALSTKDRNYAALLQANQPLLQKAVLRAEVMAGLDSPPELSRERLQAQVDVLQSSLSGQGGKSLAMQLDELCAMPGEGDAATVARIERLIKKVRSDSAS